jgi:phosphoribosylcarboxyaminoimidazole (NCAIR) mutase
VLATTDEALYERLAAWRAARTQEVLEQTLEQELPG